MDINRWSVRVELRTQQGRQARHTEEREGGRSVVGGMGMVGMWAWRVVEWAVWWAVWGLGHCVLGLLCACAGWAGGRWLRRRAWAAWLSWVELDGLAWLLHRAPLGEARLAPLRRLAAWAKAQARSHYTSPWPLPWRTSRSLPKHLLLDLLGCLEESGAVAAPLVLNVLVVPFLDSRKWLQCAAARAEVFSEASLARLRLFFLNSRDGTVDKAFLRLFNTARGGLVNFSRDEALAGSGERWAVEGRAQLGRLQDFLRDPRFLRAVRGLLMDGDPHKLFRHALSLYSSLIRVHPPLPGPSRKHWHWRLGESFLARPILLDLFRNMDRIPQFSQLCRVQLFPSEEPEEAMEVVEGFLLPQLERAEELSPGALYWLVSTFPTSPPYLGGAAPPFQTFACPLGRRLRSQLFGAFGRSLRLGHDLFWRLLDLLVLHTYHPVRGDAELFGQILDAYGSFPVADLRGIRAMEWEHVWWSLRIPSLGRAESSRLVWAGGLARVGELVLRSLYGGYHLTTMVRQARLLLCPTAFVLGPEEVERRALTWRDQGLGPLFRRVLDTPRVAEGDLRDAVRGLLQDADALLAQPAPQHSRTIPADFRFPLR